MKIEICRPGELGTCELSTWSAIQHERTELENPFLSSVFARAVGEVDPDARVAVVFDGPEIVGFVPFHRGRSGIATGLARGVAGCEGVILRPEVAFDPSLLLSAGRLSVWEFEHLTTAAPLRAPARAEPRATSLIELDGGFEAYLAGATLRHKKYFNWLRRKRQRTELDLGSITFSFKRTCPDALQHLIEWKSDQYRRSGWRDPFARPWVHELVERLVVTDEPELSGVVSTLEVHDKLLAVDFSLASSSVYAGWFVSYDQQFGHFSPGAVRWLYVIEACASANLCWIDLGAGDEEYKEKLSTRHGEVFEGHVLRFTPRAAALLAARRPRAAIERAILTRPALRATVRSSLRGIGRLRTRTSGLAGRPHERARWARRLLGERRR